MPERVIKRGSIWLVRLPPPEASEPGDDHPVLVLQINDLNRSDIHTVVGAVITSNEARADDPGNVLIKPEDSGLTRTSVVNVSQIVTFDKQWAVEKMGSLGAGKMAEVEQGLRLCLGL